MRRNGNFFPLVMLLLTIGHGAACLAGQDEDSSTGPQAMTRSARASALMRDSLCLAGGPRRDGIH